MDKQLEVVQKLKQYTGLTIKRYVHMNELIFYFVIGKKHSFQNLIDIHEDGSIIYGDNTTNLRELITIDRAIKLLKLENFR